MNYSRDPDPRAVVYAVVFRSRCSVSPIRARYGSEYTDLLQKYNYLSLILMPNGEKLDSMETEQVKFELVRVVAVVAVFVFMAVLLYYLPSSGYSGSRLVFFGVLAGAALLGAVGVIVRNIAAIAVGCSVLFLLGFWQVRLAFSSSQPPVYL